MQDSKNNIGVFSVFKVFWKSIKPQKFSFFFNIFAFSFVSIIGLMNPIYYKKFFDLLGDDINKNQTNLLIDVLLVILFINLISWIIRRVANLSINDFESKTIARIKQNSFDYMISHSHSFFVDNFAGSLVQKVGRFAKSFEKLYDTITFSVLPLLISVGVSIYVVYREEPFIAYIIAIWSIFVMTFSYLFSIWKLKYDLAVAESDSKTTGVLSDIITNHNNVDLFGNKDFESKKFKEVLNEQAKVTKFNWNIMSIFDGVQGFMIVLIEFFVFFYAVKFWKDNMITLGTFVLIQVYVVGLSHRLWDIGHIVRNIYESFADSKEMVNILSTPHNIKDKINAKDISIKNGFINFEKVSFGFNKENLIIDDFNLNIEARQKIALIGPSGAGKSTIIKLIIRLYDSLSGDIFIDNQNIEEVSQVSLRKNISLVPQDPILFHRSLFENIKYGRIDATDEEVFEASRLAHCDEFILNLKDKYDTMVGERGVKLSGGERQRIAIARAILKNAPILILDEATSSLDSHSESLIQDALNKLMENKTVIVIAHRLSTIIKMDRILVLKKGKIIEDGDHKSLLEKPRGLYKKLWNLQAGGFLKV